MTHFLSTAAAGRELGKPPNGIIRLIRSGRLTGYKIGRTYKILRSDLDAFLDAARVRPGGPGAGQAVADHRHDAADRRCAAAGL
jgi:excisionase family DNA binding protein